MNLKNNSQKNVTIGTTHNGKSCKIIDATGTLSHDTLQGLLNDLIKKRSFGLSGYSQDGQTIKLNQARFSHIQIQNQLYRLILLPYEARIEKF
mgnify:CR=1 FL=1